jgi:GR25 family glycosyltransferase involved in LPS biosynthesis
MKLKNLIIYIVLSFPALSLAAPLKSYFKPALGKTEGHKMKNIDFIYMINLDRRPEKYRETMEELAPYGIVPYRFSAVNGWELTFQDVKDIGVRFSKSMKGGFMGTSYFPSDNWEPHHEVIQNVGQTYFCHCMSRGAMGCLLSHLSVLQDAYDSGYETIWIIEDDIQVVKDPHLISEMINRLDRFVGKGNWDVFYTDPDTKNSLGEYVPCLGAAKRPNFNPEKKNNYRKREKISYDLRQIGARFGTYSMVLRRSGIGKILKFIKMHRVFLPYDMDLYLTPGIKMYSTTEDIVSTKIDAISDNGVARYLEMVEE